MNNNTKALRRAKHKQQAKLRKLSRFHNRQSWLERRLEQIGDIGDAAVAKVIGKTLQWVEKYRYGNPSTE